MGDDSTALFGLAGVLLIVSGWGAARDVAAAFDWPGYSDWYCVGFGVELTLTNAIYAVALASQLNTPPGSITSGQANARGLSPFISP
jgi:hypothetical protein